MEIFDAISYCKGASTIRMVEAYLGNESFRKGMHQYLVDHAYRNAVTMVRKYFIEIYKLKIMIIIF